MKKTPTQGRSRQTVETLIEATALVIAERGWSGATTNHIAARAGVSVGSLYQYFSSREDLLTALVEREFRRFTKRLDAAIPALLDAEPRTVIRTFLEMSFDECERDEALFAELAHQWQVTGTAVFIEGLETWFLDALRLFLARLYDLYEPINAPTVSFILTNGTMLVVTRFFTMRPAGVTRESLIEHLTDLYAVYFESRLRKPVAQPFRPPVGIGKPGAMAFNLSGRPKAPPRP